jgi:hypothetical protein
MAVLQAQGGISITLAPAIVAELGSSTIDSRITEARAEGRRVENCVGNGTRQEVIQYARARGAREVWFADGTQEVLT